MAAFLRRRNPALRVFLPEEEPDRTRYGRELARKLAEVALKRQSRRSGLLISEINGHPASDHFLASYLLDAGFVDTALGFQMRRTTASAMPMPAEATEADDMEEETTESA